MGMHSVSGGAFPATRHSLLQAAASADPQVRDRAFGTLVEGYWKPVYKYLRVRWRAGADDAQDLTQEFFTRALEKGFFDGYDPAVARFRTFLRTCVDRFVANQRRAARRLKRGGGTVTFSLDFQGAEGELLSRGIPDAVDVEEFFRREWVRSLFELAVAELRRRSQQRDRGLSFTLLERYDLEGDGGGERLTYARLAAELAVPVTQVTNHLAWARRELRAIVLDRLRELCGSEDEYRSEAREVLGTEPG